MLCVYGIVRAAHPEIDATGVSGRPVTLVRHGELAAIVSEVADDDELLARRRDVSAYMTVLETATSRGDVLPFRFGTVVADVDDLRGVLDERAADYLSLLDELSGLVQMTVKVVRDDDDAVRTVLTSDPSLRRYASAMSKSTAIEDRIALGERVAAAVAELSERDADDIVARLAPLAKRVVRDATDAPAVLSLALLVEPESLPRVDEAVAALLDTYGGRHRIDYAGPMPAYSFVTG